MAHSGRGTLVIVCLAILAAVALRNAAGRQVLARDGQGEALLCSLLDALPNPDKLGGEVSILTAWVGPDLESLFWMLVVALVATPAISFSPTSSTVRPCEPSRESSRRPSPMSSRAIAR